MKNILNNSGSVICSAAALSLCILTTGGALSFQYRGGTYGELSNKQRPKGIVLHFLICSEVVLRSHENKLGRNLKEDEFADALSKVPVIEMDIADHRAINKCANPLTLKAFRRLK